MAVLMFDGLTPYGVIGDLNGRWLVSGNVSLQTVASFPNGRGVRTGSLTQTGHYIQAALPSSTDHIIFGCFVRASGSVFNRSIHIVQFRNENNLGLGSLFVGQNGFFYQDDQNTVLISSFSAITNDPIHVEIRVHFSDVEEGDGVGSIEIRFEGETVATFEGATTTRENKNCAAIRCLEHGGGSQSWNIEEAHWHVLSVDEGIAGDFIGPPSITYKPPKADTASKAWARSAGDDNFALVDDIPSDADTTYVRSDEPDQKDLYEIEAFDLDPGSVPLALQTHSLGRVEDDGITALHHVLELDVTEEISEIFPIGSTSYRSRIGMLLETDPDTLEPWTRARLDTLVAGLLSESPLELP